MEVATLHCGHLCHLLHSACLHNCQPLYTYSRYSCSSCLFQCRCMPTQHAIPCTIGAHVLAVLPWINFQAYLKAKLAVREFKLYEYLTYICMHPMAIALNCCAKKYTEQCTPDIRICEKTQTSLVWGSLMLAPITSRKVSNYKTYSTVQMYSNRNPARHAMNSTAIVIFLPRNSIIRRVNNIPGHRRVY